MRRGLMMMFFLGGCSLFGDLSSGGLPQVQAPTLDASGDAALTDAGDKDDGDASPGKDTGPPCPGLCDNFDDPGDGGLLRGWNNTQQTSGGTLSLEPRGVNGTFALRILAPPIATNVTMSANVLRVVQPTDMLSVEYDLFAVKLSSTGQHAVGNVQLRTLRDGGEVSMGMDLYIGQSQVQLFHVVLDAAEVVPTPLAITPGVWIHVRQVIDLAARTMMVQLNNSAAATFTVSRPELATFGKPSSGFMILGLAHYLGAPATGAAEIIIDNVVVNSAAK